MKKKTTLKAPKKANVKNVKKAIKDELVKKGVSKDWISKHLIITSI